MTIVTFDRMGRNHNPPVVTLESDDPDLIGDAIFRASREHLLSRDVDISVDLEKMTATIFVGMHVAGRGKVAFA